MRILGLDVAKSSVSACLITERPKDPREFYYEHQFHRLSSDADGVSSLLALQPEIAIIEPTGINYARLWAHHLGCAGVEVRFVGHKQLRNYRENHLGLPDKDDDADALALACYQFDYDGDRKRFVEIRQPEIAKLRDWVMRLAHLNRVQSPIINRIRQDLAWQFPEVMSVKSHRGKNGEVPLLWGWLAKERASTRYDNLYKKTVGLGLTSTVIFHAQRLCNLQREEQLIEDELKQLLSESRFAPYRKAFANFGFGLRLEAVLISQIYPLQNYLGEDGKPEIKIRKGRKSGKGTKRHLSLRRFQKALGLAPSMEASGDISRSKVVSGSAFCRQAIWQWVFSRIEPRRSRPKNEIGKLLGDYLDAEKTAGKPVKLVRSRVSVKAIKLLFKELVRELQKLLE